MKELFNCLLRIWLKRTEKKFGTPLMLTKIHGLIKIFSYYHITSLQKHLRFRALVFGCAFILLYIFYSLGKPHTSLTKRQQLISLTAISNSHERKNSHKGTTYLCAVFTAIFHDGKLVQTCVREHAHTHTHTHSTNIALFMNSYILKT